MVNKLELIIYIFFCFLLQGCANWNSSNIINCDCEKTENSKFIGSTNCKRFLNKEFDNTNCQTDKKFKSGNYSVMLTNDHPYGMTYLIKNVIPKEHFKIIVWRHVANKKGCIIASAENIDDLYLVQHKSNNIIQGDWEQLSLNLIIPESAGGKDIKIYTFNAGDSLPVFFDDLSIEYLSKEITHPIIIRSSFIDARDSQKYEIVKIGNDWWMAENLNFNIPNASRCYENNEEYCKKYGKLFDYYSAIKACPSGWKIPTDEDWKRLERNLGMKEEEIEKYGDRGYDESVKLREFGSSGFNVKLAGACVDGGFYNLHRSAYFWTSTEIDRSHVSIPVWCD